MRAQVLWFAEQQEKKLALNDHKGSWELESLGYLLERLEDELRELLRACAHGDYRDVIEEAADVANFAMMVADHARRRLEE